MGSSLLSFVGPSAAVAPVKSPLAPPLQPARAAAPSSNPKATACANLSMASPYRRQCAEKRRRVNGILAANHRSLNGGRLSHQLAHGAVEAVEGERVH